MKRLVLALALVAMVSLAGCSGFVSDPSDGPGPATTVPDDRVALETNESNATGVNQTLRITAAESVNGTEWTEIGAEYPRENFTVGSAEHDAVALGVDTDDDGEMERSFDESHVSGVNNNAYSFDVTLDTDYTLRTGDVVVVGYPALDNPAEPGNYTVEVRLNDEQTANGTVAIE